MDFVLDASVTVAWCFSDETTPMSLQLLESLKTDRAIVPELWKLEVGNALISAEKRKRISYADIINSLSLLESLTIHTDRETHERGFREIIAIAHAEKLTTYDAAYLELAMRLGIPLATKNAALLAAAKRTGIEVIPV